MRSSTGRPCTCSSRAGSASDAPTSWLSRATSAPSVSAARASSSSATRKRVPARLLQHLPAPWARAARAGHVEEPPRRSSARTTPGSTSSMARWVPRRASATSRVSIVPSTRCSPPASRNGVAGSSSTLTVPRPAFAEHVGNLDALIAPWETERLFVGRDPLLRDRRELEDGHRELPRVLPLPVDPPRALRRHPDRLGRRTSRTTVCGSAATWS